VDQESPDKIFERRWAMTLLEQVMAALQAEFLASGKALLFEELKQFLSGDEDHTAYAELSRRTGLSDGTLRVNVHRLRQRYRELLRLEIGYTVDSSDAIDDEIRHLFNALI
jgi:RNA polymerase sigma-70 factor (ECF subfamily)